MRVVAEAEQKRAERLVHHRVMGDFMLELREFRLVGQFAVHQQISDFEEARMFGQLFDGITAVHQYAVVAVYIGDGGTARSGRHEAGVVGEQAGFFRQFCDIDAGIAEGAGMHRQDDRLLAGGHGDLGGNRGILLRHGALPCSLNDMNTGPHTGGNMFGEGSRNRSRDVLRLSHTVIGTKL